MLAIVKQVLGITNTEFDDVINSYINACKLDLTSIGIKEVNDDLYNMAIITYVRAFFDETNYEGFMKSYNMQKEYLRKCEIYVQ